MNKTPDEIKKGLERCSSEAMFCAPEDPRCSYDCGDEVCIYNLMRDALAYIQQLDADNAQQARCIENLTDKLNATNEALPRWVSVEDDVPLTADDVLCLVTSGFQFVGYFDGIRGHWELYEQSRESVTHWMPLPEPPKEE